MADRDARAADTHAAGRAWLRGMAVGAILAAGVAVANAATRADAVITALALEQGRHCVVSRGQAQGEAADVTVRGDACDGRRFIRAVLALLTATDAKAAPLDLDLDIGVKTLDGFHGEALRDVRLRLSVRRGVIAAFAFAAKLGNRDVSGRLRAAANRGPAIAFEADDAGAFLRWSGLYRGVRGGALMIALDVPSADGVVDEGVVSLRYFRIADDPPLRPLARLLGPHGAAHPQLAFTHLRVPFKSQSGRVIFSDGLFNGEPIAGTLAGSFDFAQNRLDLRGVVVPTIQFSPVVPIFFPWDSGLIGSDYAVSGPPSTPVLRIDPLRTLQPGFLRKLLEFEPGEHHLEP